MAVKAWDLAQKAVDELPPYLGDDELTADRLYKRNQGKLSGIDDARKLLDALVEAGELRSADRRNKKGGGHVKAYLPV